MTLLVAPLDQLRPASPVAPGPSALIAIEGCLVIGANQAV